MIRPKCTKDCAAKFFRPSSGTIAVDESSVYTVYLQLIFQRDHPESTMQARLDSQQKDDKKYLRLL